MTIAYPLSLPNARGLRRITFRHHSAVGRSISPFTFAQQVFVHQGEMWSAVLEFGEMDRDDAIAWIAWRLSLNGMEGTFLLGDPKNTGPRGTWSAPVIEGAHAAGVKTLTIRNVDGLTWKAGDWLQLGSGSSARLHQVVQDGAQVGSPSIGTVEIWPRTREALTDGATITLSNPKGLFQLAQNNAEWTIDPDESYTLPPLEVEEALRG